MLDYSIKIPQGYWSPTNGQGGTLVDDSYAGRNFCTYLPFGYSDQNKYDVFYFKMGTNNTGRQFFTFSGQTSHFEYVLDNLIANEEIRPCIVVAVNGEKPNGSWLPANAEGLIYYVEGKYSTYMNRAKNQVIPSAPHRALGGWSLGSIEARTILVNDLKNDFYKFFNWYDIQSGYNAKKMNTIDPLPFVGCAAGSKDDGGCITFTKTCATYFAQNPALNKNTAQIVNGYQHYIKYQLNYFYNAIKYFFGCY